MEELQQDAGGFGGGNFFFRLPIFLQIQRSGALLFQHFAAFQRIKRFEQIPAVHPFCG